MPLRGLSFEPARCAVWGVTAEGAVIVVRLHDQSVATLGIGYVDPVAAVPLADALTLAVVERDGRVWHADRADADRANAGEVAAVPGGALAAAPQLDGSLLVLAGGSVDEGAGAQLLRCRPAEGSLTRLGPEALPGAYAIITDPGDSTVRIAGLAADGTTTLTRIDLATGALVETTGLPALPQLTTSPDGAQPGVLAYDGTQLLLIDDAGATIAAEPVNTPIDGLTRWGSLVLATTGTDLLAIDWGLTDGELAVDAPLGPLYIEGYARVGVDLAGAGLRPTDVEFQVREPDGGQISAAIEVAEAGDPYAVMLLAGPWPGEYHLDAVAVADGRTLATRRFRVTMRWPDDAVGPPVVTTAAGVGWGGIGGVAGYLSQGRPAPNLWKTVVVLVHLRDRDWTGVEQAAKGEWAGRITGPGETVQRYYEEVSAYQVGVHGTTVTLLGNQVFGPVLVDCGWGDLFRPSTRKGEDPGWWLKDGAWRDVSSAISWYFDKLPGGGSIIEFADSVTVVVRSGTDGPTTVGKTTTPTKYCWPHAPGISDQMNNFFYRTPRGWQWKHLPLAMMSDRYPAKADAGDNTRILCHELGHNLGLGDLYDDDGNYGAEVDDRLIGPLDLMGSNSPLPHFSLANRIRLGWVKREQLRRFDFRADPTGGMALLQSTESLTAGGPSNGRVAGVEVPINDDWSYLFEYRVTQTGRLGDQLLHRTVVSGRTQIVVGTDLRIKGSEVARPPILRLGRDPDNDGSLMWIDGQDYRDSDTTNPQRMHDFTLTATDIAFGGPETTQVDVTYVAAHRPQLMMHASGPENGFKSPDIAVLGPNGPGFNAVVLGATNSILIGIHNEGTLEARDVRIHVRWLPFTTTAGPWRALPDPPPFTVPGKSQRTVIVPWPVPDRVSVTEFGVAANEKKKTKEARHFCVRVDIDRYTDPANPAHDEVVVHDNWAQSNFDEASIAFGSPSERISTVVLADNALDRTAAYSFEAGQSSDWYRIYLGHAWLELEPGEARGLELAYESLAGDPLRGREFEENIESITATDNQVTLRSWVQPVGTDCPSPRLVSGAGLTLRAGRKTWIEEIRRDNDLIVVRVRAQSNGLVFDVPGGDLHLATWFEEEPDVVRMTVGRITNGIGQVNLSEETFADLLNGRPIWYVLGRAADNAFAAVATAPARLE